MADALETAIEAAVQRALKAFLKDELEPLLKSARARTEDELDLLTPKQIAKLSGYKVETVRAKLAKGEIKGRLFNGHWRARRADVQVWIDTGGRLTEAPDVDADQEAADLVARMKSKR